MISEAAMWWWGGVAMAVAAAGGVVWAVGGDWWKTRKLRNAGGLRRCRKCLFDMSGLTTLVCPECGKKARNEKSLRGVRRRWGIAALCLSLMNVAWFVSKVPEIRDGDFNSIPTWALMMGESVIDLLDPHVEADLRGLRSRILGEVQERYKSGVVSPISDSTLNLSKRIWAIEASRRNRELGVDIVETHFDLSEVAPDELWRQSALPEWPDDEDTRGTCGMAYMSRTHVKLRDWTLFRWNRRKQYQCYRSILEVVLGLAEHDDTNSTRCELDLSGRELIRWGDAVDVPYARAILKEIKEAGVETNRQPKAWFTQGTIVDGEIIQVCYWPESLSQDYKELLDKSIRRVIDRDDVWECEPIPRMAGLWYNGSEFKILRMQVQWQQEVCSEFLEAIKRRGVVVDP